MTTFTSPDGTRLAYAEVGAGPPLLCLPGGPGRAAAYLEELGGLSAERTLVLLDARATGRSEVPADPASLRFDRLAADVEALRSHLGLEQAEVLGHSAGAIVAQAWAAQHPTRVRSLALLTPSDHLQGGTREDVAQIRAARGDEPWYADARQAELALPDASPGERRTLERAVRPFFYGRWDEQTQEHAASADRQMSRRAELGFAAGAEQVDTGELLTELGRLDAPVLVVGAARDGVTGVAAAEHVAACFARARLEVLPAAGHFPWVDEPAAVHTLLRDWLQSLS